MEEEDLNVDMDHRCFCCNRTEEMIDILNQYFGREISLKQIGLYEELLCSECIAELQQITFEQVYYGNNKIRSKDLQDKCIAILINREHPDAMVDEELCSLLVFYRERIESLKHRAQFSIDDLRTYFNESMSEWNATHRHKCFVSMEPITSTGTMFNIFVRMTLSPSKSEGFAVRIELRSNSAGLDPSDIIPFKVD